jgi:hypothetical protein
MTPKEYKQMMDYLTRSGIRKQVKFASDIARPDPKPRVQEIDAINAFMRRNPINKANGGRIGFKDKPLKNFNRNPKGQNQFSGKLLTENMDLVNAIKEDAKTMSQIEVEKKYKGQLGKKTLKKIKDKYDIDFRKSYKAVPKKSIPYKDRFTTAEKSAMYKKRKATETEEDRIKAKERDKKYRDKVFKEYKMEPSSRTFYDDLWKDIARSAKEGDRIKLIEGPKYSSGASYKDFQSRVFLDTKTNERFTYDTLKNYLNSGKLEGVTYDSVIKPYELKNKIANSGLKEEIQKAYFGDKYKPPSKFRAQNTFHVHHIGGVAADPFKVQLTFADQNLGLVTNKKFNTEWARLIENNAPLSERKAYLKFVKSKTGENIAQTLEFPEVGKTRTYGEIGTDMQKLLSDDRFKQVKGLSAYMKENFKDEIVCNLSKGINCNDPRAYQKSINQLTQKARQGDKAARATLTKFTNKAATAGRFIKNALGPLAIASEIAIEGGIALNKTLQTGVPLKTAFADSIFNLALGPKLQIDKEAELKKEFAKGEDFAMAERGRRMMIPQSATADAQRLKKREQQREQAFPTTSPQEIDEILKTQDMTIQDFGMTYPQIQDFIKQDQQMQAIADAGGVANLAGGGIAKEAGDSSGPPPEKGPMSQGLPGLLKRGIKT